MVVTVVVFRSNFPHNHFRNLTNVLLSYFESISQSVTFRDLSEYWRQFNVVGQLSDFLEFSLDNLPDVLKVRVFVFDLDDRHGDGEEDDAEVEGSTPDLSMLSRVL